MQAHRWTAAEVAAASKWLNVLTTGGCALLHACIFSTDVKHTDGVMLELLQVSGQNC